MKTHSQKGLRGGYSLVEMSLALALMIMLGLAMLFLLNTHVNFMRMMRTQTFLAKEAPRIGNLLTRLLNQADHFFIYSLPAELANPDSVPVSAGGRALKLYFSDPNNPTESREIHLRVDQAGLGIAINVVDPLDNSSWMLCRGIIDANNGVGIQDAVFDVDRGMLRATLFGSAQEVISYYAGAR